MKTLVKQSDNVSIYLFNDSRSVTIASDKIIVGADAGDTVIVNGDTRSNRTNYKVDAFVIGDHNSSTVTLHTSVATPPQDSEDPPNTIWEGGKYTYNGSAWAAV